MLLPARHITVKSVGDLPHRSSMADGWSERKPELQKVATRWQSVCVTDYFGKGVICIKTHQVALVVSGKRCQKTHVLTQSRLRGYYCMWIPQTALRHYRLLVRK